MSGRLEGKVAVITGAAMGQGREACKVFAEQGARIIGMDVDEARLAETVGMVKAAGGQMAGYKADVSDEAQVKAAVEAGHAEFGAINIVYNNAGVLWRDYDFSVVDTPRDHWDKVIAINLTSVFLVLKFCVPKMKEAGGGSIINVGSISALVGFSRPQDAYTAAKGALISLTKSLAVQYGPDNIRANVIHPGIIDTPMQATEMAKPEWVEDVVGSIPLRRVGQPRDIANAALFLASDEASWVTGAELLVDGGFIAT